MLIWLLAGVALLCAGLYLVRLATTADPRTAAFVAKILGIVVLLLLGGYLVLSGRAGWLLGLLPLILPFMLRRVGWRSAAAFGGSGGSSALGTSHVRTGFLDMRLDHISGELDGEVLEGRYVGRLLSEMSLSDLRELERDLTRSDRKSARLLEAYLDRRDPEWRTCHEKSGNGQAAEESGAGPYGHENPGTATMSAEEAYRVLGLASGASELEVKEAYHRLISSVHPDRGGSSFLAAQVNRAKDVLLRTKRR